MDESMALVTVTGTSMLPTLHPSDSVIIARSNSYEPGAILVFQYKSEGYIIHRLLSVSNDHFLCKGDNAFRLENVIIRNVLGKVLFVKHDNRIFSPPAVDSNFIRMSMDVHIEFANTGYDVEETKKSDVYTQFRCKYLTCGND